MAPHDLDEGRMSDLLSSSLLRASSIIIRHSTFSIAIALNLFAFLLFRYLNSPWRRLPPGPTGYPLIGSALRFFDPSWLVGESPKYGDIVYLNVAGRPTVILNTQKAATTLLDRRSSNYSGRPRMIVANEIMCDNKFLVLEPFNDRFRQKRRAIHEGFNKSASSRFQPALEEDAIRLASSLTQDAEAFRKYYHTFACSMVLGVTYDRPLLGRPEDEQLRERIEAFVKRAQETTAPGAYYVELLPWMKYLPAWMAKWKRDALATRRETTSFFMELKDEVATRMVRGLVRPCLAATMLEDAGRFQLSALETAWAAGFMYTAGSSTTSTMLEFWTLAMVAFPNIQRKAQAEIDTVVGRGRLPTFSDRAHLPYTTALLREVLRWRTGLPFGVPHTSEADDYYEGMFIPKGTVLLANIMPCNQDRAVYGDDAHVFNPERHLDQSGQLAPAPAFTKDHGHVSFGFGRRICVGQHVAMDALFIATTMLLWSFTLEKAKGADGQEIEVDAEGYNDAGLLLAPKDFECAIRPRFADVDALLSTEKERHA
ncbi:unnamed protein product [Peniophora sp. CBMAI 1063]|nr:unnamed protein product [Peniophora sp. CBMAI 1063]